MVGDPFADWPGTIAKIQQLLKTLNIKIPIETLFAEKGLKLDQTAMTVTKLERMDVNANNVFINGVSMGQAQSMPSTSTLPADVWSAYAKGDPATVAAVNSHAEATAALAAAELALAESLFASSTSGDVTTINVTVEGTVISEGDLAATITNMQYEMQRRGQNVVMDSVAI
jgi:hypothetical protein